MKVANLYVRVSTDEQAEKGYSQRNQEEVLRRYCELKYIIVNKVYYEDHSAKTFNRPVWKKLLVDFRKNKGQAKLLLFTKWDRFSRNTGDAYYMINLLRRFGVEPQAIEQPLDLDVPENKMMLAFYLASPEVENDRRSLNIFHGTRRAKKEGRWVSTAPVGYANKSYENGRKYIAPNEPQATIMKEAFQDIASGKYNVSQVYNLAKAKGITCKLNNFWNLIRNPMYCGKLLVQAYKDEEEHLVAALHEPLITEALFYRVQDMLDGKKKKMVSKVVSLDLLPLRGYLNCPKCTRKLSGSSSKGQSGLHYHYYHCSSSCGVRHKAEVVNSAFMDEMDTITPRAGYEDFYVKVIGKAYKMKAAGAQDESKEIMKQITALYAKVTNARDLVLSGDFEKGDYLAVKADCEKQIAVLESYLPEISDATRNIDQMLTKSFSNLSKAVFSYKNGDMEKKRSIVSSLYPARLVFDGIKHRTPRESDMVHNTLLINKALGTKKNWTSAELQHLSSMVVSAGIEPATQGFSVLCSTD